MPRLKHILILAMFVLLSATSTFASINEVRVYVEGLACPFCTFGIEKNLKKVPGIVSLETTIRTGLVRIQMEPGASLDPAALNLKFPGPVRKNPCDLREIDMGGGAAF